MFHRDFPPDAKEMWDVIAKALLLRAGGSVDLLNNELRDAAGTQAEIELTDSGLRFRVERQ